MLIIQSSTCRFVSLIVALLLSGLFIIPKFSFASDLSGSKPQNEVRGSVQKSGGKELPAGHRYIEGTVEEVNANTIRIDAGDAGDITPRYLNLDNIKGNEDIKPGDTLRIEVNAQNKVVKYQKTK